MRNLPQHIHHTNTHRANEAGSLLSHLCFGLLHQDFLFVLYLFVGCGVFFGGGEGAGRGSFNFQLYRDKSISRFLLAAQTYTNKCQFPEAADLLKPSCVGITQAKDSNGSTHEDLNWRRYHFFGLNKMFWHWSSLLELFRDLYKIQ